MHRLPLIAAAAVAIAAPAHAQELSSRADAIMERLYADDLPGASAIVVQNGKTTYLGARGMADIAAGEALAGDSQFRMGSITKQFTAAMVMKLVEEGKIDLSAPITDYLEDAPEAWNAVNVHQLLNHTSGIHPYTANAALMGNAAWTASKLSTAQMVAVIADAPADFAPGQRQQYNNSGYVLLGAIVEQVTGKPWYQAIQDELLRPNGITGIHYMGEEAELDRFAQGYGSEAKIARAIDGSVPHAAGALVGDVAALAAWYQALMGGKIVSRDSLARMTTPTATYDGQVEKYGYGLAVGEFLAHRTVGHGGGIFGFNTYSEYLPDDDLFVAVFSNSDSPAVRPEVTTQRLIAAALGQDLPMYEAIEVDEAAIAPWVGTYGEGDKARSLRLVDGKPVTKVDGRDIPLHYAGDGILFTDPGMATGWAKLTRTDDGELAIAFHDDGAVEPRIVARSGDLEPEPEFVDVSTLDVSAILGSYQWPIGVFTVAVDADGNVTGQLVGQGPVPMKPVSLTEWHATDVGAILSFTVEEGKATKMRLRQGPVDIEGPRID